MADAKPSIRAWSKVLSEYSAEDAVDLGGGDPGQRKPPDQVHVAGLVQGEVHAEHAAAALQQEPVERGVVLVRLAAEERLHVQAVRAHDQPGHRGQLVLAREPDQVRAGPRRLVAQAKVGQGLLDRGRRAAGGAGHASTGAGAAAGVMAEVYTRWSASTVSPQPNRDACSLAPADSRATRPGTVTRSLMARA